MCFSILVLKRVCQYGHLNEWDSCWAQCEDQMAANLRDWDFDRLCDNLEFEFPEIKSHAKRHTATANPSNCEVCRSLEQTAPEWVACRDALVVKRSQLKQRQERDAVFEKKLTKLEAEAGSRNAIEGVQLEQLNNMVKLRDLEDEVKRYEVDLEIREASEANQETVKAESNMLRTLPMSTLHDTTTRKFFLGHFQEGEDEIREWEEGTFDQHLIIDYTPAGQPQSPFSSEGAVDLSPPDGVIGLTDTNALLDFWRRHPQRTIRRRLST